MYSLEEIILFILRISPLTIYQITFSSIIITGELKYLIFALGMIICELSNQLLKRVFKKKRPSSKGLVNGKCTGCGVIPRYNKESNTYGMPSGHAQLVGYVTMFWTLYLMKKGLFNPERYFPAIITIFILWTFSILVCWSRINNQCHSFKQVTTGFSIGSIIGYFFFSFNSVSI